MFPSISEREALELDEFRRWRQRIIECVNLIGKKFVSDTGEECIFFGLVYSDDDYYYGMFGNGKLRLLSCVGSIAGHGFELLEQNGIK